MDLRAGWIKEWPVRVAGLNEAWCGVFIETWLLSDLNLWHRLRILPPTSTQALDLMLERISRIGPFLLPWVWIFQPDECVLSKSFVCAVCQTQILKHSPGYAAIRQQNSLPWLPLAVRIMLHTPSLWHCSSDFH